MTALAAYFDDSRDPGMMVLAGYLATVDEWDCFSRLWNRMIENAPRPTRELKMSDLRHGQGDFAEWSDDERESLIASAVSLISESDLFGVGSGMMFPIPDEHSLNRGFEYLSYQTCAMGVVAHTVSMAREYVSGELARIQLIFDEQPKTPHLLRRAFQSAQKLYLPVGSDVVAPVAGQSHELPALQAADLLAHETLKELKNRREDPERKVSWPLRQIVSARPHCGSYLNLSTEAAGVMEIGEAVPGADDVILGTLYESQGVGPARGRRRELRPDD